MEVVSVANVHSVVTSLMYIRLPPSPEPSLVYSTVGGAIGQVIPIPSLPVSQKAIRLQKRIEDLLNENEPVDESLFPSYVLIRLETTRRRESLTVISVLSMRISLKPRKGGSRRSAK